MISNRLEYTGADTTLPLFIFKRRDTMGCRRKLKKERELVADIHKTFVNFCSKQNCKECKFRNSDNCEIDYIKSLLGEDIKDCIKRIMKKDNEN